MEPPPLLGALTCPRFGHRARREALGQYIRARWPAVRVLLETVHDQLLEFGGMGNSVRVCIGGAGVLTWAINSCMGELAVNTS